ncbi:MAG: hypothetical protein NTW28_13245, partial [Candidatus Solibacter sp.]|nr:hypothetical protein [Candidatus Solibacter sp.]
MQKSTYDKPNGAYHSTLGVKAQSAKKSDRYWDDVDFQDGLVHRLVNNREVLEKCAAILDPDDFQPKKGMRDGRARWVVAERALKHYQKHDEPIGTGLRADVLQHVKSIGFGASQIEELEKYFVLLGELKPNAATFYIENVAAFKSGLFLHGVVEEVV